MPRITHTTAIAAAALIAATVGTTFGASAHDRRLADIDSRQSRQLDAIEAGRRDGSLTWLEGYSLRREQARIRELERAALADGTLTDQEVRTIAQAQDDAARHIRRERHDDQVRGWWWRTWH